jgi:hypothetical protein
MALELNGTTGVSLVQNGVITDANLPAGSVLQVVQGTYSTEVTNTTSSMIDTGLEVSITPISASNKVLVFYTVNCQKNAGNAASGVNFRLLRNGSIILNRTPNMAARSGASEVVSDTVSFNYLDSPSSTSAVTYKFQFKDDTNTSATVQVDSSISTLILMEIAG